MPHGMRFAGIIIAIGLLVAVAYSGLRLLELREIEDGLALAERHLMSADLEATAADLLPLEGKKLSASQTKQRDDLIRRLLDLGVKRYPPVRSVAGQGFDGRRGAVFRVASPMPAAVVVIQPRELRAWVREVRLGEQAVSISLDEQSHRVRLKIPEASDGGEPELYVPLNVIYSAGGAPERRLPFGSFRVIFDKRAPSVVVGEGSRRRTFAHPTSEEVRIPTLPGHPPAIVIEDSIGIERVRWIIDGTHMSRTPPAGQDRSWRLPLDESLFRADVRDIVLLVEPENRLGNRNRVELRFAVRSPTFNPVQRIYVDGNLLDANSTLTVPSSKIVVQLELKPGENSAQLALRSGGRYYPLRLDEKGLSATIVLDEGKPTGLSLLKGKRVLASYALQVANR